MTGFYDIQVNGYGGVDFNQDGLSAEDMHRACQRLAADGVDGILATIITDSEPRMITRLRRIVELREKDSLARQLIVGIHIEGPFLNPQDGYRGAHPLDSIRPADAELTRRLLEAAQGLTRVFTLAPEQDPDCQVVKLLCNEGIIVSAGHTDTSLEQLQKAIQSGLSLFTHLGNGCPASLPRHDNIIQRALTVREDLWLCFIADGVHIPFFALQNYLELIGRHGKCLLATDAMAAAGLGPGKYQLGRWNVLVKEDLVARNENGSHLLGSALSMPRVAANLAKQLKLDDDYINDLLKSRPRQLLHL